MWQWQLAFPHLRNRSISEARRIRGGSSKERSRCALRWRNAKVGVRVSDCILLIYISKIPQTTADASEKENASISENALSPWRSSGSVQEPTHLTEPLTIRRQVRTGFSRRKQREQRSDLLLRFLCVLLLNFSPKMRFASGCKRTTLGKISERNIYG